MSSIQVSGNASGTGTFQIAAPNSNTNRTLTLPDGTGTFTVSGVNSNIVAGTAVASTSGTSITFTGIPSWVKRITVMFDGVSTTGTAQPTLRLGNGSIVVIGYKSNVIQLPNASAIAGATSANASAIFLTNTWAASYDLIGMLTITNISGNTWTVASVLGSSTTTQGFMSTGSLALSSALDRIQITTSNGTDTFDAGSINILYE